MTWPSAAAVLPALPRLWRRPTTGLRRCCLSANSCWAAGTAAAMTDDFTALDVSRLQKTLEQDGVVLHEDELTTPIQ